MHKAVDSVLTRQLKIQLRLSKAKYRENLNNGDVHNSCQMDDNYLDVTIIQALNYSTNLLKQSLEHKLFDIKWGSKLRKFN